MNIILVLELDHVKTKSIHKQQRCFYDDTQRYLINSVVYFTIRVYNTMQFQ